MTRFLFLPSLIAGFVLTQLRCQAVDWADNLTEQILLNLAQQPQFADSSVIVGGLDDGGSGSVISADWVLTAAHVVAGAQASQTSITYFEDGQAYQLRPTAIYADPNSDLELMYFAGGLPGSPTPIPPNLSVNPTGDQIWNVGWGVAGPYGGTQKSDGLHAGNNTVSSTSGANIYYNMNTLSTDPGSTEFESSTAPGDSGGGMYLQNGYQWTVTGTVYGFGVDTSTVSEANWIKSTTGLTLTPRAAPTSLIWNTDYGMGSSTDIDPVNSTRATDGSGTWNTQSPNFTDQTYDYSWENGTRMNVVFGNGNGAAGTVTLGANITVGNITFDAASSGNYTIAGGGYGLTFFTGGSTITANVNATLSAPMSGGALTKEGAGTLTLTGANTYTGTTSVDAGTLKLDFSAAGAPTSNIINNSGNNSSLAMGGGQLAVVGQGIASAANSQQFNGTSIAAGGNTFTVATGNATNTVLVNLGALTESGGGTVNFVQPTGDATLGAANGYVTSTANGASGILGGWATVNGTDWAANNGTNIVAYTGYTGTNTQGSTIASNANSNVQINAITTGGNDVLGSTVTSLNTLMQDTSGASTVAVAAGQTLNLGASGGIFVNANAGSTGNLTIGASPGVGSVDAGGATPNNAGTLFLTNDSASLLTVNSDIVDNGSGPVAVAVSGAGTSVFAGANTYSGGTDVDGGVLRLAAAGAAGTGAISVSDTGILNDAVAGGVTSSQGVTIAAGGRIVLNGNGASYQNVTYSPFALNVAGSGPSGNDGAIDFADSGEGNLSTFTYNGATVLSASTTIGMFGIGNTVDLGGGISGTGTLTLSSDGANTGSNYYVLNGVESQNGGTTIETFASGTSVKMGTNGVLAPGLLSFVNVTANQPDDVASFDLDGTSQSVAGISGTPNGTSLDQIINSNNAHASTLTLTPAGSVTYGGTIGSATAGTSNIALVMDGPGTQILSGANTFTGGVTLDAGVLQVDATETAGTSGPLGASGIISFGGGTLQYSTVDAYDYSSRFSTAANQMYNVDTNGQTVTWATGLTSSGGSLTVANNSGSPGELILSGMNSYSGGTTLDSGSLYIATGSSAGTGNVTVNSGTLAFWNTVNSSQALLSPVATGSTVTVNSGGTLYFDENTASSGLTNTYNSFNLDLNGGTVQFGNENVATFNVPGKIVLTGIGTFTSNNIGDTLNLSGGISGSGSLALVGNGASNAHTLKLSAANTYGGSTSITAETAGAVLLLAGGTNTLAHRHHGDPKRGREQCGGTESRRDKSKPHRVA